jgi:hypothetical protein
MDFEYHEWIRAISGGAYRPISWDYHEIEIDNVYNMYRVKPVAVCEPSKQCHVGNL